MIVINKVLQPFAQCPTMATSVAFRGNWTFVLLESTEYLVRCASTQVSKQRHSLSNHVEQEETFLIDLIVLMWIYTWVLGLSIKGKSIMLLWNEFSHNFTYCLKILSNCTRLNGSYNFKGVFKLTRQVLVKFWLCTVKETSFTQKMYQRRTNIIVFRAPFTELSQTV